MKILAVVKDTGGMNAVIPVVKELYSMGKTVYSAANGVSVQVLKPVGYACMEAKSPEQVIERWGIPDVLLTSMCSEGGVGRDLVPVLRGKSITVAVQDQWGGRLLTDWQDEQYRPDYIVVNDSVGAHIVQKAWPEYAADQIKILGYASLDVLSGFDVQAVSRRVRETLEIHSDTKVAYFSGQLAGTGAAIEETIRAVNKLGSYFPDLVFLAGKHPRLDVNNVALARGAEQWGRATAALEVETRSLPSGSDKIPELDLIATADVTVGMYPTALMHAAALRKLVMSILYPGSEMQEAYRQDTGGLMNIHPLVKLGAVAGPRDYEELVQCLHEALDGNLGSKLEDAQRKHVVVDGCNAHRIAEFVSSLAR